MDIWSAYHPSIDLHTIWSIDSLTCLLSCRASSTDRPSDQPPPNDDEFIHLLAYRPVCHGHVALTLSLSLGVVRSRSQSSPSSAPSPRKRWTPQVRHGQWSNVIMLGETIIEWRGWLNDLPIIAYVAWCANCVSSRLSVFEIVIRRFIDDGRIGK